MTEQEKRDRIIERLDRCSGEITCNDCSRVNFCEELDAYRVCQDALALLKAQEPRVMTLEEIRRRPDLAWIEEREPSNIYIALFDFNAISGLWEYAHIWNKYGEDTMFLFASYNKRWRCWTQKPTDEQREAIPWE